ncbi:hypothetical protein GOP47_0001080 [Adiantum capillus-veneris]|uniref:Uncharacterized protein n=1 Tax=Adiantum capillus-veneris TaxID=13818 RepID=A0A9D4ZSW0_ADICA|nr:hypothetical protein GOP47_0001080 [Adiantum capillus-veneris]
MQSTPSFFCRVPPKSSATFSLYHPQPAATLPLRCPLTSWSPSFSALALPSSACKRPTFSGHRPLLQRSLHLLMMTPLAALGCFDSTPLAIIKGLPCLWCGSPSARRPPSQLAALPSSMQTGSLLDVITLPPPGSPTFPSPGGPRPLLSLAPWQH